MPYLPHTQEEIDAMLAVVGVDSLEALYRAADRALYRSKAEKHLPDRERITVYHLGEEASASVA